MDAIAEVLIAGFLVIAGVFGLVGSFGLIKLRDPMQRLHAPTKATTVGVGGVLIASMLYFFLIVDGFSIHELLITLFLFLTAPITANFIAKVYIAKAMTPEELPGTGRELGWSIHDDPPRQLTAQLEPRDPGSR
jgi:multicomponent K+:H+ antiporter subunit G